MFTVALFSGGRGTASITREALARRYWALTAIVNAYDDGKSSGDIKQFFGILGPSDVRKAQSWMLPGGAGKSTAVDKLYEARFPQDANGEDVVRSLLEFAEGGSDVLAGVECPNAPVTDSLRKWVSFFVRGLLLHQDRLARAFPFSDCSVMNCVFAGAWLSQKGDLSDTSEALGKAFGAMGRVLVTSSEHRTLIGIRENGEILSSEAEIVELRANARIADLFLVREVPPQGLLDGMAVEEKRGCLELLDAPIRADGRVIQTVGQSDLILFGPGTQHSSLFPTYMTRGIAEAVVQNRRALRVMVTNIGEDYETPRYTASELLEGANRYMSKGAQRALVPADWCDVALVNSPAGRGHNYIQNDLENVEDWGGVRVVVDDFEMASHPGKHDGKKVVDCIERLSRCER